jgi:hypothetical protein
VKPGVSHSRNSQQFMEPEDPLPCLQEPTTGHCPNTNESSPHITHPVTLRSILVSSYLRLDLPSGEEYKL